VYDYAVVRLKLAVVGHTRFLPLAVPRPEVLQMPIHFLGFPEDESQLFRSVCVDSMALDDGNLIMTRYVQELIETKINLWIYIAPTQPFWAALGAESRVCYPGNTADRQTI
jgi:hypothetical protein